MTGTALPGVAVTVNGAPQRLSPGTTVAAVVDGFAPSPNGIAVARNREVVPRSLWADTPVSDGDHLEIVTAAAGG